MFDDRFLIVGNTVWHQLVVQSFLESKVQKRDCEPIMNDWIEAASLFWREQVLSDWTKTLNCKTLQFMDFHKEYFTSRKFTDEYYETSILAR